MKDITTPFAIALVAMSGWMDALEPALEVLLLALGVGIAVLTFLVKIEELKTKRLARMQVTARVKGFGPDGRFKADLEVEEVEYEVESKATAPKGKPHDEQD